MAEEIRDLIEKINQEGIKAAEEKARSIEAAALQKADDILVRARREAEEMIAAANDRIRREEEKGKTLLAQAGRDLLLSLRKEMDVMLGRLMVTDIRQTLTPEALFNLISGVVGNYSAGENSEITVFLNEEDLKILEKSFLARLREETKKNIVLKPAEEISGGFTISFDDGKSSFDFTDKALADYLGTYVRPKLHQILQDATKEMK